jgi:AmmeMemoRadiSam system protein A
MDDLVSLARITLESYYATGKIPEYYTSRHDLRRRAGAFVTLRRKGELRGCIGQLIPDRELYRIVQQCAVSAAVEDPRFAPVVPEELPEISIEISVLTPFRRVRDVKEIQLGRHGLFVVNGASRGLLLPQVAEEHNLDVPAFLEQTCRKAGLPESAWQDPVTEIFVFEAQIICEDDPSSS